MKMKFALERLAIVLAAGVAVQSYAAFDPDIGDQFTLWGGISGLNSIGKVTYGATTTPTIYAGAFNLTAKSGSTTLGSFYTFCTDVGIYWAQGKTYVAENFTTAWPGVSPSWSANPESIENASWLYNTFWGNPANNINNLTPTKAAGMQLAIWEALYDTPETGTPTYSLTGTTAGYFKNASSGGFSGAVVTEANNFLASLWNAKYGSAGGWVTYDSTWLGPKNNDSQGFIFSDVTPVPEPATYLAAIFLCVPIAVNGIRVYRKRRLG